MANSLGQSLLESNSAVNPAAMTLDTSDYVILRTKPSRFGISELSPFMLNSKFSIDEMRSIGLNLTGLGGNLYSEVSGEIRFSNKFADILTLGLSYEYSRLSIKDYGITGLSTFNIGAVLEMADDLNAGFLLRNVTRNYTESYDKTIYQQSVIGLAYRIADNMIIEADAGIIINSNTTLGLGFKYMPHTDISVRTAYRTNPNIFELGVIYSAFQDISIMLSIEHNELLGTNPEIALRYIF
ncbi:MAG: hypothetical protein KIT33_02550 [Candidatus Kapabacteria bacterium]|nr:hypothetical protein [Ignavibacteriota bacterium]MCW5883830.1 hypothetical protein [Candidatus Kapabacteria bacterium]